MDHLSEKLDKRCLSKAYEQTDYKLMEHEIHIRCGRLNPELDEHLVMNQKTNWIFITAHNPQSVAQSTKVNAWNNANLEIDIATSGHDYDYAAGESDSKDWPAEDSFIVYNISMGAARKLAEKYKQNAILVGSIQKPARLEWM